MLEILQCYQTKNRSYEKKKTPIQPIGILVHSTGATNKTLKRWVDAPERLGKNLYGNHWNSALANKSMHAFIGYDKDQKIIVAHTLPYDRACWGAGKGGNGSANYNPTAYLQFEICQGNNTDAAYYWAVIDIAEKYCAHLCQQFGWTAADITSHSEAHKDGLASNHGDPISWMRHFGDDMNQFRKRVALRLGGEISPPAVLSPNPANTIPQEAEAPTEAPAQENSFKEVYDMKTLRNGSHSTQVRVLQWLLNDGHYNAGVIDGIFGSNTLAAVKAFQADNGLEADGIVGRKTWKMLLKE